MNTHFVFDRNAFHIITRTNRTIGVHHELRHDEQRDALYTFRRTLDTRQYKMNNIVRVIVFAECDKNFLPGNLVGAVGLWNCLRAHQRQIGAGLRLGEVHRGRPLARHHLWQEHVFERL